MKVLEGQRALVTGASSGIGEGIAKALAVAGATVAVNYTSGAARAEAVVADIVKDGGKAVAVGADVSQEDQVDGLFDRLRSEWGSVDILVNNAGLQRDSPIQDRAWRIGTVFSA